MKVVIYTNIYISFLIGKILKNLIDDVISNDIEILTSIEQEKEIFDVVNRDKFKKYFGNAEKIELFYLLENTCKKIDIRKKVDDCIDKKDNFLLDIAINGKADYIISGDGHLLKMNPYGKIKIITYSEFKKNFIK